MVTIGFIELAARAALDVGVSPTPAVIVCTTPLMVWAADLSPLREELVSFCA